MTKDYIIIGAGISGINTANRIKEIGLGTHLILEKSRGVGGRMATRRTLNTKFDHGAQFYKVKVDSKVVHTYWKENNISHQWFVSASGDHWCSHSGMTALPKAMLNNTNTLLEKQITSIIFEEDKWKLESDKGEVWFCKNLIISSPLPQTLKLIENIHHSTLIRKEDLSEIEKISYTKALVGLITLEEDIDFDRNGYQEFFTGDIFSIADQKSKGLSAIPALTVTMSPEFSEREFEATEDVILEKIQQVLFKQLPNIKIKEIQLKKWRYCQATSSYKNLFLELYPNLYLIGDAFGGSSLLGAIRSSNALCDFLINTK